MNIPVLGIVENYSYFLCPDNNKKYKIFGESNIDEIAKQHEIKPGLFHNEPHFSLIIIKETPFRPFRASIIPRTDSFQYLRSDHFYLIKETYSYKFSMQWSCLYQSAANCIA